jgi:hypothetical protein
MDLLQSASKMNQQILSTKVKTAPLVDNVDLENKIKKLMGDNALLQKLIKQKELDLN